MKANEAPEKLYFFEGEPILSARSKKLESTGIEYIRKDAFIEKACEWIKSMWSETDNRFKEDYTGMLIDNFKNYIKGE